MLIMVFIFYAKLYKEMFFFLLGHMQCFKEKQMVKIFYFFILTLAKNKSMHHTYLFLLILHTHPSKHTITIYTMCHNPIFDLF
jgi:hypothetical protein